MNIVELIPIRTMPETRGFLEGLNFDFNCEKKHKVLSCRYFRLARIFLGFDITWLLERRKAMSLKKTLIGLLLMVFFINPGYCQDNNNPDNPKKSGKTILASKDTTQTIPMGNTFEPNTVEDELSQEKLKAEVCKLQEEAEKLTAEVSKLREETDIIKNSNNAPDKSFRWLSVWLTALGGILLGMIGFLLNSTLNRTQKRKIKHQKKLNDEKHLLKVFRELSSDKFQIRIGAVAILIQRLNKIKNGKPKKGLKKINKNDKSKDEERKYDLPMIASVLLSVTKREDDIIIQKYIADGLVKALGAIVEVKRTDGKKNKIPSEKESILKMYGLDFQKTKLYDVLWKRIDARGVDFFGAYLAKASLRESFLQEAIFYEADLTDAILIEANLESANLEKAILKNANFTRAKLINANLTEANLVGANLSDVDLSTSIIDGADFRDAIFNRNTKLKRDQLGKAKFNEGISQIVTLID